MHCTRESVGQVEMDVLVGAVVSIYANHDKNRSLWDIWCHSLHHAAGVAEEIRKISITDWTADKLKQEIADLALWVFTMLGKLKGSLGDPAPNQPCRDWMIRISVGASSLMWNRYPGVCPWCYCAIHLDDSLAASGADVCGPCRCDELQIAGGRKDKVELRARAQRTRGLARQNMSLKPLSLDGWQGMIGMLYGRRLKQLSLSDVALHLLEEMGEVSDALVRMYTYLETDSIERELVARQIRLEDELADVLSWLFGLAECLSSKQTQLDPRETVRLSTILWGKYGSDEIESFWCRHCRSIICECPVLLIQSEGEVARISSDLRKGHL
jgi:NTP pyrophosphatase (non-canonical NTP hydrolase)